MGTDRALGLMNEMLWAAMEIGGPVLIATLVVGLLISIVQVATQVQEITLSYVPKMLVAVFVLIALGPWMLARLTEFARSLYLLIPTLAQ
jgi:flagellar biosynthetic protein FliQ